MPEKHRTVSRVIKILELAAGSQDGLTLTDISSELGAARSSVHGFVKGLEAEGYLTETDAGRYVFGLGAHTLLASQSTSLVELVAPAMHDIQHVTNETVTLAVYLGDSISYVHSVPSGERIAYCPEMHTRRPLWPTSAGKLFLASPEGHGHVSRVVDSLGLSMSNVSDELARVRDIGFAANIGETVADVTAFAVGFAIAGRLAGAITVGGPNVRLQGKIESFVGETRTALAGNGLQPINF